MKRSPFLIGIVAVFPAMAALNVPLTVKEAVYSGSIAGVSRTAEPVTLGVPIPDSAGISNTNVLGLTGAASAQFMVEGRWPSGNIKWLKVRAIVPSVSSGGTATLTLTDSGAGDFGGSALATDDGATITVSTGAATFTIRKSNYNVLDVVDVGSTHVVLSGASTGIVLLGPDPSAPYPGNVTCLPTAGGTACNSPYTSANDATSTVVIEENGPAMVVLKATGNLTDTASHAYMGFTQRLTFTKNKASVAQVTILRNAEYGTSNTFATASKGFQGLEIRVGLNLSGSLNYSIANHSGVTNGSLNQASDYAYLYQAESNQMKASNWCTGLPGCVLPTSLTGYAILANGKVATSGNASQYPVGWADIRDSSGAGVEIGQYYLAGYGNKSLEFQGGGTDVRVGLWASENNTQSVSTLTPNKPYYQRWPQWNTQESWMIFHAAALSSPADEHLRLQHPLMARAASTSYVNSTGVIPYPLLDPAEEDSYYSSVVSSASPAVTKTNATDLVLGTTANSDQACSTTVCAWRYWRWPQSGGANQMEFRRGQLFRWLQRGFAGGYVQAKNWYRLTGDLAWPQSDGFNWASKPAGEKQYYDFPTATSVNAAQAMGDQIENDGEHANMQGLFLYYWLSGDETVKEYADAYSDAFLNVAASNSYTKPGPAIWNARALGNVFMSLSQVYDYLSSTGQAADASTILTRGQAVFSALVAPDLCAYPGYPAGCTPDNTSNIPQLGISQTRGISNQWRDTSVSLANACAAIIPASPRTQATFMTGRMLEGMWEWLQTIGSGASYYNQLFDYTYGSVQWALGEMYADNGSTASYLGNGWRYKQAVDYPNACNALAPNEFSVKNTHPGMFFFIKNQYDGSTNWKRNFDFLVQNDFHDGTTDELYHYVVGSNIYALKHSSNLTLNTAPITGFTDNGGGSYKITWNVPPGSASYRIKWGNKQIVDWIGFDAKTYAFTGDPVNTMNWFAATDAANVPAPSGATQSLTINTGVTGLTAANFMVKAYSTGVAGGPPPADTIAPAVSITSPASGATVSGAVTISATASDNVGVTAVQFRLDGANFGNPVAGPGPLFTTSWNTGSATGAHVLSAVATDASGNTGASVAISVTINAASAPPVISAVVAAAVTESSSTITWSTSTPSDTQVQYGLTTGYGGATAPTPTMATVHSASITGLNASTTYHFRVLSRDAQGNLGQSGDFTFTTNAASAPSNGGTAVPSNTWTSVPAKGWPAEILNYDKSEYVSSRKLHCVWGAYKQYLSSEHNNALVCYSYAENRWTVLENNGYWHSSHAGGVGHTVSVWAYMADKDALAYQVDGSGSNSPQSFVGLWWWYDVGALNGQNRTFSPRPWLGVTTPLVEMLTYDTFNKKLIIYDQAGAIQVCDPNTNACAKPAISGGAIPANLTSPNMVYNSTNHKMYIYGGGNANGANVYTFACNTSACTSATAEVLSVTCVGADCVNGKPPVRLAAGMAYSPVDNIFLMVGGIPSYASNAFFNDTWSFDPTTLQWKELSPASNYFASRNFFTADRLTYDPDSNVFLLMSINGYAPTIYAFPYSAASDYGRISNTYTPPPGSLNRVQPTATSQSWAMDPAIAASGGTVYLGWIETGSNTDNSVCGQTHHPYVQSSSDNTVWTPLPGGSMSQACVALDPELNGSTNGSKLRLAVVNGTLWEAHEKINHNQGFDSEAFARQWNGTTWTGGQVGCFFAACSEKLRQNPQALIGVGGAPTMAVIEWNRLTYSPEGYVYVAQWNGSTWSALGGKLNAGGTGTQALDVALASDGSRPAACWTEQVIGTDRRTVTATSRIYCAQWDGATWARFGSASLNRDPASWANDPALTYAGGKFYISWTERTTGGMNKLYACRWDGGNCTLLGGGALNVNQSTGWAVHPSLANDGANVYLAWEEQPAQSRVSTGYVKKWDGSAWSALGGALNADPANGSVQGITLEVVQGAPTAVWAELTYGNLRQIYEKQWNGTSWGGNAGPPPVATCDLNGDGKVDQIDVQSAKDQALGVAPCTNADLEQIGRCSVVGVQRIINATLGQTCRIGQ